MKTDWNLIREMIGAAIDACERIEAAGYTENDRDATIDVGGQQVSVQDFLVSAWTLAEKLRYQICQRRSKNRPRGGAKVGHYGAGLRPPGGLKPERGSQAGAAIF